MDTATLGPPTTARAPEESAKRRQILDGARRVFLSLGFDGASMSDIARDAGVSKGTLYVYFDSKEALFEALVREDRRLQAEQVCRLEPGDHDVAAALRRFGHGLLEAMSSPDSIAQVRMVMGVTAKFPRIGRAFYESGPAHGVERLASYLAGQDLARLPDLTAARAAAVDFVNLCQGDVTKRLLFGAAETATGAEIAAAVERAVAAFTTLYPARDGVR